MASVLLAIVRLHVISIPPSSRPQDYILRTIRPGLFPTFSQKTSLVLGPGVWVVRTGGDILFCFQQYHITLARPAQTISKPQSVHHPPQAWLRTVIVVECNDHDQSFYCSNQNLSAHTLVWSRLYQVAVLVFWFIPQFCIHLITGL